MILLTEKQHELVKLNVKVTLTWVNDEGEWFGPYVSKEDFVTFIKHK